MFAFAHTHTHTHTKKRNQGIYDLKQQTDKHTQRVRVRECTYAFNDRERERADGQKSGDHEKH